MARITVEDCLKKIDSQYDLVLLAKERTSQLNAGDPALVPIDNDKNTVVALREIAEGKVSVKTLEDSGIDKLRKHQEQVAEPENEIDEQDDDFDKIYKGEVSKSGTAILPSKRAKRMTDKIKVNSKSLNEDEKTQKQEEIEEQSEIKPLADDSKPE